MPSALDDAIDCTPTVFYTPGAHASMAKIVNSIQNTGVAQQQRRSGERLGLKRSFGQTL